MPEHNVHTADSVIELLLRHRRTVWWLCLRHARGEIDYGRELMQEVVAVLARCTPQLQAEVESKEERAWVRNTTRNILSVLSRKPKLPTVPLNAKHDRAATDVNREQRELVDELASHLDDDDRQLLKLHLDGFSHHEVGIILGLKDATVRQRMHRIVGNMRLIYEKLYNTHIQ